MKVGLISLGCAKNLVDAEVMLGALLRDGIEITNDAANADVMIVNTCSFIDSAQEESVDAILESAQVREAQNRGQGLIVSGCLPQRFREDLPKLLPEVDAFIGIDQVPRITEIVRQAVANRAARIKTAGPATKHTKTKPTIPPAGASTAGSNGPSAARPSAPARMGHAAAGPASPQPLIDVTQRPRYIPDYATPRFRLTPPHFAYLKIAEGCNHPCSFCIIPRMRGLHRSRGLDDIVAEARGLIASGVKELNLISQDSTYYGLDLRPSPSRAIAAPDRFAAALQSLAPDEASICSLLRRLDALPGDFWIRLLYTHPAHWTDELIHTIAACPKIARYVDIPLQHIHPNMLERMRRETTREYIVDLLARLRAGIPGIALRTTFIVGFPGETEACFDSLLDFIRAARFERLGIFTYSKEEGTRAANMSGHVSDAIKRKRRDLAMAAQHQIASEVSSSFVGRTLKVLVERPANARELKQARISSWEHGLIRGADENTGRLKGRYLLARGEADAPDIDGRVYVRGILSAGEFAPVRVVGHTDYDLLAEPAA